MIAGIGRKHWFALIVLLTMSAHYLYFRVPFIANDYGRNMVDWPLLGDLRVSFPLLYYFMFRPLWKAFLLKWLVFAMAGFAFGSLIIPDGSKDLWRGVERLWPLLAVKPVFAWVVDVLSVWSVLYLVAEYRASRCAPGSPYQARTPISLCIGLNAINASGSSISMTTSL